MNDIIFIDDEMMVQSCFPIFIFFLVNLALHRPTYQISTGLFSHPSSQLVDGRKSSLAIRDGQCSVTTPGQTFALWRVDLQSVRRIERVTIYSLTENKPWGKISSISWEVALEKQIGNLTV